jgi:hypothetical protein
MDVQTFHYVFENNNILLENLIHFYFLKLILESSNFIEKYTLDIHETHAVVFVLFKHLFEDFGYSQKYIYVDVIREKKDNVIKYIINPLALEEKLDADFLPVDFFISFTIITPNKIMVEFSIKWLEEIPFVENMKTVVKKTFSNLKQYIDKLE